MKPEADGICPYCENTRGEVGEPCPYRNCARRGYHFIPSAWLEASKDLADRRRLPIDPLLGRCIDRYLLAGKLGEGGMGSVYLAIQKPLGRQVALKLIAGRRMDDVTISRFRIEAQALSILDHPNIVKLHDYGVDQESGKPYMVIEYVRHGRSLRRTLAEVRNRGGGRIPASVVLTIFEQILSALAAAHAVGIVHRDMKPANVLVSRVHGNPLMVKILDFGLAKAMPEVTGMDQDLAADEEHLMGTPFYMAPEQNPLSGRPVDGRADLYSVTVMLYEVFTGTRLFEGRNALEILRKKEDPSFRPEDRPEAAGLPPALRALIRKGLSIRPEGRFATADQMTEALRAALSGQVPTAVGLKAQDSGSSQSRQWTPPSAPPGGQIGRGRHDVQEDWERSDIEPDVMEDIREMEGASRIRRWWPWIAGPIAGILFIGLILLMAAPGEKNPAVGGRAPEEVVSQADTAPPTEVSAAREEPVPAPAPPLQVGPALHSFAVSARPAGAVVKIDGTPIGKAPTTFSFTAAGAVEMQRLVEVSASAPGYNTVSRRIRLCDAVRDGVTLELKKKDWVPPL